MYCIVRSWVSVGSFLDVKCKIRPMASDGAMRSDGAIWSDGAMQSDVGSKTSICSIQGVANLRYKQGIGVRR